MIPIVHFSSVTQLCQTHCDPMDCSTPGFPVHHQNSELAQIYVHQVGDAIQPSHPLSSPSPPDFNLSQHQGFFFFFLMIQFFAWDSQSTRVSASASVLSMNIQDWFPLGWTGLTSSQSKGLSRVHSKATVQSINSLVLSFLYGPTLKSIHVYWKNHSFVYMDLWWQSDLSAFYYAV